MKNHVHLAVQVGTIPLSQIMQNLSFRYACWVNRRRKQTGHLFQGRYKAILVDLDSYLLQLTAYLHLNPVRAGMVVAAELYPWSSHRCYLGEVSIPWLSVEPVLSILSPRVARAQHLFAEFVDQQRDQGHRKEFHGKTGMDNRIYGEDSFVGEALRQANQESHVRPGLDHVLQAVRDVFGVSDAELLDRGQGVYISEVRAFLAWAVIEQSDATLAELSQWLGKDVSTLSSAVRRLKNRAENDPEILEKVVQIKDALIKFASLKA